MSRYALPDLRYDYGALEPHISGKIVELHHGKHHAAYVKAANEAIEQMQEVRAKVFDKAPPVLAAELGALAQKLAFNVSGHVLHSLYWQNLTPGGGGDPDGDLRDAIARDFGSFARFKSQLVATAMGVMGSGWAALVWDPLLKRLGTTQIHDHQSHVTQGSIPLLVLDVWEHAYYLQYQADKAKYLDAIWSLWNWGDVAARLRNAQVLDLGLIDTALDPAAPLVADDEPHQPEHP
jgi:superoxide dismutase, Fe-Mn family